MNNVDEYLPVQINSGSWLTRYTLDELHRRISGTKVVLPVCSLGTQVSRLAELAPLVLPPLYHEALDAGLKSALLSRINQCFPYYEGTRNRDGVATDFEIVELPAAQDAPSAQAKILAFSVDTAVEEHGPHLPLMTDTIQSYAVLRRLATEVEGFVVGPPIEYGHLTWGLPFGLSIDITPPLLTRYVTGFVNAILDWMSPEMLYVVDVHGSQVHRDAIQQGLQQSRAERWAFRWLHEPLVEFAAERGDQHAGGVETALVEQINPALTDSAWWPGRVDELASGEMKLDLAAELSPDLPRFIQTVETGPFNGIVGNIRNYFDLDAAELMQRMLDVARGDVRRLVGES
jgi:creatinine amidohydrolase/Fe(II)-dependent formamide hydrolase-like protein